MLVAAAFAPHPPLMVPEVAAGAAGELDGLRAAGVEAVRRLAASRPGRVVMLGAGSPPARRWDGADVGSLAGYGVARTVPLGPAARRGPAPGLPPMPLSATVGAWLLQQAGYAGPRYAVTVPAASTDAELAGWAGRILSGGGGGGADVGGDRVGLLVMGDGSARRSAAAPGHLDSRAAGFDARVAAALREADPAALRSLDPALGAELLAAGVPAWRLAGQAAAAAGPFDAELLYQHAPYGVGYLVAVWLT